MADVFNDGNVPFGSQVVTIGGASYVAEDIEPDEKSTSIIRRDEVNVPNGAVHIRDLMKAKMTLQLSTTDSAIPDLLSTTSFVVNGQSKSFIITGVSQPFKQDQIHKLKLELTEQLNS